VVVPVAGAPGARTRTAVWRPYLGCVQTPDGADYGAVSGVLPFVSGLAPPKDAPPLPASRRLFPALEAAVAGAFDRETVGAGTETTAVLIVRDGTIVAERYRDGFDAQTPQRTWSVAKSIAATIIGAAVQDGLIAVDEPAGLEAWSTPGDPRAAITIENLLHMASGLDAGAVGSRTHDVYFGGGRVIDHAVTNRLIAEPGARWFYANNDTMAAIRALRERLEAAQGPGAHLRYPFEALLGPLGMRATFLETDWNGDFVLSSQVWTTARDLARLGLLYLGDGVWNGRRILPEGWAAYVATPAPAQPPNPGRFGYGAQFWLAGPDSGLPAGTYAAFGNRGQHLVIIPERNMLVVRRGFDEIGGTRFDIAAFVRDILAASEESAP
ncbi:MAG: serine hydrolase, partial [Pseudomonadota bacterium]